jgi:hypothetical protein
MVVKPSAAILISTCVVVFFSIQVRANQQVSEERFVEPFEHIYLNGSAQLHLVQSRDGERQRTGHVRISGSPASLERLTIENADGVLYIDAGDRDDPEDLVIYLTVSVLSEVVTQGRGQVFADGLTLDSLSLEGHGSGRFELKRLDVEDLIVVGKGDSSFQVSGAVEHQFIDLAGMGRYQASELASQESQVNVRGAGQVDLWVEELLDINVFGAARVRYSGTPWVMQKVLGSGAIDRHR